MRQNFKIASHSCLIPIRDMAVNNFKTAYTTAENTAIVKSKLDYLNFLFLKINTTQQKRL